jgi:hypothetical protein
MEPLRLKGMENFCGECNLCCKLMRVDEVETPRGRWCKHAKPGHGCGIYADRPTPCREYECLWLQAKKQGGGYEMPEDLKPNRSRVVIDFTTDGKHPLLHVDADFPHAIDSLPVRAFIDMNMKRNIDVYVWTGEVQEIIYAPHGRRVVVGKTLTGVSEREPDEKV